MIAKKALQLAFGLCLAAFFLWLTLKDIDPVQMHRSLASANLGYVIFAFVAVIAGYSCRVQRWRLMLSYANPELSWGECAGPFLASFATNNILPFRAGDVMRAFAFNVELRATSGVVLATVVVERMLDLLIIIAAFGAAIAFFDVSSKNLVGVGGVLFVGMAMVVGFALIQPRVMIPAMKTVASHATRAMPRLGATISEETNKIAVTFEHLAQRRRLGLLVLWSVLVWMLEGCAFWFAALAVASLFVPAGGWLALPVSALATLIPSTPGYVGTFDYFTIVAMRAVGNEITSAAAYAFLIHLIVWLPSTVGGGGYLLLRFLKGGSSASRQEQSPRADQLSNTDASHRITR